MTGEQLYEAILGCEFPDSTTCPIDGRVVARFRARLDKRFRSQERFCLGATFAKPTLKKIERQFSGRHRVQTIRDLIEAFQKLDSKFNAKQFLKESVTDSSFLKTPKLGNVRSFRIRCRILVPFLCCPNPSKQLPPKESSTASSTLVRTGGALYFSDHESSLYGFSHGVGVWVIEHEKEFSRIADYAIFRRSLYDEILELDSHGICEHPHTRQLRLAIPREQLADLPKAFSYCLHLVEVTQSNWPSAHLDTALRLLAAPSLLLSRFDPNTPIDPEVELQYFSNGVPGTHFHAFGVEGIISAHAHWAGVAISVHDPARSICFDDLTNYEIALQSVWMYMDAIIRQPSTFVNRVFRAERSRLAALLSEVQEIGPRDFTIVRQMKEALVATSRFREKGQQALDVLL